MVGRPSILYLSTVDWAFLLHRLPMARAARRAGFNVIVGTRVVNSGDQVLSEGFELVNLPFRRGEKKPWNEADVFWRLWRLLRDYRPEIVHNFSLKPVLYGSLVGRVARAPVVVNSITGMGYLFSGPKSKAGLLSPVVGMALKALLRNKRSRAVVQNHDDRRELLSMGIPKNRIVLIAGSGVDTAAFDVSPEPEGDVVVTMVSRVLWDKGVGEFVKAAEILANKTPPMRFVLVGDPDPENPASVPMSQIQEWSQSGVIEWSGHRSDISNVWSESHIAVLPSYREGMPKVLLEAGACGRPVVTTDVPGCREFVVEGENGFLVPARDPVALSVAISKLAGDSALRRRMGERCRERVVRTYSDQVVAGKILDLYRSVTRCEILW